MRHLKLAKKNKVPVVILLNHGNFLNQPFWSHYKFRKVPFYATLKQILTAEDVEKLSVEEQTFIFAHEVCHIAFNHILRSEGKAKFAMIGLTTGGILNIVLDPILIFGYLGLPKMGVAGAAVAIFKKKK